MKHKGIYVFNMNADYQYSSRASNDEAASTNIHMFTKYCLSIVTYLSQII